MAAKKDETPQHASPVPDQNVIYDEVTDGPAVDKTGTPVHLAKADEPAANQATGLEWSVDEKDVKKIEQGDLPYQAAGLEWAVLAEGSK